MIYNLRFKHILNIHKEFISDIAKINNIDIDTEIISRGFIYEDNCLYLNFFTERVNEDFFCREDDYYRQNSINTIPMDWYYPDNTFLKTLIFCHKLFTEIAMINKNISCIMLMCMDTIDDGADFDDESEYKVSITLKIFAKSAPVSSLFSDLSRFHNGNAKFESKSDITTFIHELRSTR
ncbi:hypothetical protein JCM15831A_03160 [Asaia astilbis]